MKIGILDSGLGGLSVLYTAKRLLPDFEYIYYADEEHVPYGEKTPELVREYTMNAIDFLVEKGADAVVIACNTATSATPKAIRTTYPIPVVGMEPAVKEAVRVYGNSDRKILVAATEITIKGEKLINLIDNVDVNHQVTTVALPGLVRFAERGMYDGAEVVLYLREALKDYNMENYDCVVLGCTHFYFFKKAFQDAFGKHIHFADGNLGTIKQVLRCLESDVNILDNSDDETVKAKAVKVDFDIYFSGGEVDDAGKIRVEKSFLQLSKMYEVN